jgi:hypothetical protein
MSESIEVLEIAVSAFAPDTASIVRDETMPLIEEALQDANQLDLLANGNLSIEMEETFPTDPLTIFLVTSLTREASKIIDQVVIPALQKRFGVEVRARRAMKESSDSKDQLK